MGSRYAPSGDDNLDSRIAGWLEKIVEKVKTIPHAADVAAIILGGGYGRGEGGVMRQSDGSDALYNDLDLFVITEHACRSLRRQVDAELHVISEELSELIGVDVDFGPARNRSDFGAVATTMMWQELKRGYEVIYGSPDILDPLPEIDLNRIPLEEGAKLLLNRGTGLLLARERLFKDNPDAEDLDFAARNIWKAVMACGDVYLLAGRDYSFSYQRRLELLEKRRDEELIVDFYDFYHRSIDFKFNPRYFSLDELTDLWPDICRFFERFYLYFFGKCCQCEFKKISELQQEIYRRDIFNRGFSLSRTIKNLVINGMEIGWRNFNLKLFVRYPRFRLFIILPALLFDYELDLCYICLMPYAVAVGKIDRCEMLTQYLKLWRRFN